MGSTSWTGWGILWAALIVLTGWRLTVLARTDAPTPWHKTTTLLFVIAAASNTFNLPPIRAALDTVTPALGYLCGYLLLVIMYSGFIYLFASGEKTRPRWVRSARIQLGIAAITCAAITGLWLATPPAERATRLLDLGRQASPLPYLGFVVLGSYLLAASTLCAVLAWGESRYTVRSARSGYVLSAVGMAVTGFGGVILRVPLVADAWIHGTAITDTHDTAARTLNLTGIALLLLGLGLIAAHPALEPRRAFLALRPLCRIIAAPLPRLDLWPERPYLRELLYSNHALRGRWPYRAIVCRDRLRPLGEHIAPSDIAPSHTSPDDAIDIDEQARLVLLALDRARRGDAPVNPDQPCRFAVPTADTSFDSDVEHLIALSRALARQQKKADPDRIIRENG